VILSAMTALQKCVEILAVLARTSGPNRIVLMERAIDSFTNDCGADDEADTARWTIWRIRSRVRDGIGSSRRSLWNTSRSNGTGSPRISALADHPSQEQITKSPSRSSQPPDRIPSRSRI